MSEYKHWQDLRDEIAPILRGNKPEMIGAALADLVAIFVAGINPEIRKEQTDLWIETMLNLVRLNIEIGIENRKFPHDWRGVQS